MRNKILVLGLAASFAACAHKSAEHSSETAASAAREAPEIDAGLGKAAHAEIAPRSGNAGLSGRATFIETTDGVKLLVRVTGAPAGEHGLHIHETGDCSDPEAKSAGGHWNPAG